MKKQKRKPVFTILVAGNYWLVDDLGKRIGGLPSGISLAIFAVEMNIFNLLENPETIPKEVWEIAKREVVRRKAKK